MMLPDRSYAFLPEKNLGKSMAFLKLVPEFWINSFKMNVLPDVVQKVQESLRKRVKLKIRKLAKSMTYWPGTVFRNGSLSV